MTLLIDNDVTSRVLEMGDAINALEEAFHQVNIDTGAIRQLDNTWFPASDEGNYYRYGDHLGAILDPPRLAHRIKSDIRSYQDGREIRYNVSPGQNMRFVMLFDATDGELLALLNDRELQRTRVGATAGIACKYLSRDDAEEVGMIGAGAMARAYAAAFAEVRDISSLKVYSPTTENRESYAEEMSDKLDIHAQAVDSPEEAVSGVDIVSTCTNSEKPVYYPEWIESGQFITTVREKEITEGVKEQVDQMYITTNQPYTERQIDDADQTIGDGPLTETNFPTIDELVASAEKRESEQETLLYNNVSSGIQFVAVCNLIYEQAVENDLGTKIPLEWFQQKVDQ